MGDIYASVTPLCDRHADRGILLIILDPETSRPTAPKYFYVVGPNRKTGLTRPKLRVKPRRVSCPN